MYTLPARSIFFLQVTTKCISVCFKAAIADDQRPYMDQAHYHLHRLAQEQAAPQEQREIDGMSVFST